MFNSNLRVLVLVAASCGALATSSLVNPPSPPSVRGVSAEGMLHQDPVSATLRDNVVFFTNTVNVQFVEKGHSITAGQPYAGARSSGTSVTVRAGRKGSPEPAAAFKSGITAMQMLGLDTAVLGPKELNFMTYGAMTFTVGSRRLKCPDFRLGQGHNSNGNNWWVGSSDCASVPTGSQLTCCCGAKLCHNGHGNYAISITPGSGNHEFYVKYSSGSFPPLPPPPASKAVSDRMLHQDPVKTTPHDNWVSFANADEVYFAEWGHSITAGQPYGGVWSSDNKLDVRAGRKCSPEVAAAFKNGITAMQMLGLDSDVLAPKELNFMTYGSMAFTVGGRTFTCPDFRLAQGHNSKSGNNWWVASLDCASVPTGSQLTCCCGAKMCNGGHGNYAISITPGSGNHEFYVESPMVSRPEVKPLASVTGVAADDRSCGELMTACNFDSDCCSGVCRQGLSVWSCA